MAGLVSEIATRLRDRARDAGASAGRNEAYARQEREFAALLTEAADRYAKGEAIEAVAILAAAFPTPLGRGIVDDIADLRRALGKDALAGAIGRLP